MRAILILDMSYILKMFRERQLEQALESRKLAGYFGKVISVHPLAGLFEAGDKRFGDPVITKLDDSHVFVEGKVGVRQAWRFLAPLNFLLSQARLVRLLLKMAREAKVDAIRVGDPYYIGLMGLMLSWLLRVPLVIRIGSNWDKCYEETGKSAMPRLFKKRWVEKIIERFVLKRADLVAGANLDNLNHAIANGARKEFTTLFRYGNLLHPSHQVCPNQRPSVDDVLKGMGLFASKFAMYIGRLEQVKMPDHVIMVIAELKKKGYNLKVLMVGDGSMKEDLIISAKKLNIEKEVIFVGNKNQQWIAGVLPHATVALSPHTGRALTEAALGGVPIVAYDIDWQSELIKTGQTGELVEYNNWSAMADATMKILDNPIYAEGMGRNVRKAVMEMMDPGKLCEHERNEYEKLFDRKQRTRS